MIAGRPRIQIKSIFSRNPIKLSGEGAVKTRSKMPGKVYSQLIGNSCFWRGGGGRVPPLPAPKLCGKKIKLGKVLNILQSQNSSK